LTPHAGTHIDVLRAFLDVDVQVEESAADVWTVRVSRAGAARG
jgi:hypothetical protein